MRQTLDIVAWRELAWTNAQRLAAAPNAAARRAVAGDIGRNAVAMARRIQAALPATAAVNRRRDAFCRRAQPTPRAHLRPESPVRGRRALAVAVARGTEAARR
jgi:hypothetical protein